MKESETLLLDNPIHLKLFHSHYSLFLFLKIHSGELCVSQGELHTTQHFELLEFKPQESAGTYQL